jgi:hypothetical protein
MTNTIASDDAERAERLDFASYDAQQALSRIFSEIFERFDKEQLEAFAAAYRRISNTLPDGTRQFYKRSGYGGRAAAIMQLAAVIDFFEALLGDGTLTLPLQALLWTLKDLDAGIVGPMAERKPISNRSPDTRSRKVTRLYAAMTMQFLMDIGPDKGKRHAAEAVAKILCQAGITIKRTRGDDRINWKTVAKWREQVQAEIKAASVLRERLDQMRRDGVDLEGTQVDDREIRNRVLSNLALLLAQRGESYDPKFVDRLLDLDGAVALPISAIRRLRSAGWRVDQPNEQQIPEPGEIFPSNIPLSDAAGSE